jgi:hypothetical protein
MICVFLTLDRAPSRSILSTSTFFFSTKLSNNEIINGFRKNRENSFSGIFQVVFFVRGIIEMFASSIFRQQIQMKIVSESEI